MPCDYSKYPADWKTVIRPRILERAGDCCEWCGVVNGKLIQRATFNGAVYRYAEDPPGTVAGNRVGYDLDKQIRVVLTVAHLDHDTTNNDPANLAALCQRCHLRYDAPMKSAKRKGKNSC